MSNKDTWDLSRGDPITADLTAMRLLGGGAAYEAYLAFDDITYSPVVVKVLRPGQVDDGSSGRGLAREVRALDEINHPVVVRGLRHALDGRRPHVVLEQVDGPRLSTLIRRYGPLQEQPYLPLAIDVASALHYLRAVGYMHLDIKPSNLIMGAPARLIDPSVARTLEQAANLAWPIGTDAYMAPAPAATTATSVAGSPATTCGTQAGGGSTTSTPTARRSSVSVSSPGSRTTSASIPTSVPSSPATTPASPRASSTATLPR